MPTPFEDLKNTFFSTENIETVYECLVDDLQSRSGIVVRPYNHYLDYMINTMKELWKYTHKSLDARTIRKETLLSLNATSMDRAHIGIRKANPHLIRPPNHIKNTSHLRIPQHRLPPMQTLPVHPIPKQSGLGAQHMTIPPRVPMERPYVSIPPGQPRHQVCQPPLQRTLHPPIEDQSTTIDKIGDEIPIKVEVPDLSTDIANLFASDSEPESESIEVNKSSVEQCTSIKDLIDKQGEGDTQIVDDTQEYVKCTEVNDTNTTLRPISEVKEYKSGEERSIVSDETQIKVTEEIIEISSADRDIKMYPRTNKYTIPFVHDNVVNVSLVSHYVNIQRTNINDTNNRFYFSEDADQMHTIEIPSKDYTIDDLLHALGDYMNKIGRYRYILSVNETTRRITIEQIKSPNTSIQQFHLHFAHTVNNIGRVLGFSNKDYKASRRYEAPAPYDFGGICTVQASITAPGLLQGIVVYFNKDSVLYKCQRLYDGIPKQFYTLTVHFKDLSGRSFDIGNDDHRFTIKVTKSVSNETHVEEVKLPKMVAINQVTSTLQPLDL